MNILTEYLASNDWLINPHDEKLTASNGRLKVEVDYDNHSVKLFGFVESSRNIVVWTIDFQSVPSSVIIAAINAVNP